jgi:hypothetical protein
MTQTETVSDAKLLEALKLLEQEHKDLELRKIGLTAYLNVKRANQGMEKEKAALQNDLTTLKTAIKAANDAHEKEKQARQAAWDKEQADHDAEKAILVETAQKELAGLKASIAKAKKQAADTEKETEKRIADAKEKAEKQEALAQGTLDGLNQQIKDKEARIAALDKEFSQLAQKHGLAAAVNG